VPAHAAESAVDEPASRLHYDVVDVFTDRAFAGNPLAVVYGAASLPTAALLAIASEFNLSETAFPISLTAADLEAGADYRLRIFTPGGEIPFAGHPTLGSAWSLCHRGSLAPGDRTQACGAGLIGVRLSSDRLAPVELCAVPRDLATELPPDAVRAVAESVGLRRDDVIGPTYVAGCGLSFIHLRVAPAAVARARPGMAPVSDLPLGNLALRDPLEGVNVFAVAGDAARAVVLPVNARVFVPGLSVPEDPATGSAAVGLGIALCALGLALPDGETRYQIMQGVEMGRPSTLHGRVEALAGQPVACRVAGQVVPVATGTIAVPAL
jgi:trans-2,3-dihydro-3-hydroxyanthranilate isomerase